MVFRKTEAGIQRAENKRARILTAALEHMADVGWPKFDGHTVAANVKMATGTIYVYFKSMPELVNEAIGLLACADATAMRSQHPDPHERYRRAVAAVINRSNEQRIATQASTHPVYRAAITRELEDAILHVWGGRIDGAPPCVLVASAVYGALFGVLAVEPHPSNRLRAMMTSMAERMVEAPELVS